eukprot:4507408-Pleurochrysis_carterae.AAC.1
MHRASTRRHTRLTRPSGAEAHETLTACTRPHRRTQARAHVARGLHASSHARNERASRMK